MAFEEAVLREFKTAVFNTGTSPERVYVEFLAETIGWPVDALAPQAVSNSGEYRVAWLKDDILGHAVCRTGESPLAKASVHPLHTVLRAEVRGTVRDNMGISPTIVRSLTVYFTDGDPLMIDLSTFSHWTQGEAADQFITAVLDAIS